jgi:MscS family membrane protein
MEKILYDIRSMLTAHNGIAHDQTLLVRFDRFEDSYLGIFVYTFTNTSDWARYLEIREDILLKIMEIVEENDASFAFPSQSIYVEKFPASMEKHSMEREV